MKGFSTLVNVITDIHYNTIGMCLLGGRSGCSISQQGSNIIFYASWNLIDEDFFFSSILFAMNGGRERLERIYW